MCDALLITVVWRWPEFKLVAFVVITSFSRFEAITAVFNATLIVSRSVVVDLVCKYAFKILNLQMNHLLRHNANSATSFTQVRG